MEANLDEYDKTQNMENLDNQDIFEARDVDFSKNPSEVLSEEVQHLRQEANDFKDKYLRALADFENFKKRSLKERSDILKYQGQSVIVDLLEVLDGFDRAILTPEESDPKVFREGILMIHKMLASIMAKNEVRGESALGGEFNPLKHEAISQIPSPEHKAGSVIGELKKAYFYKDKIIRHGQVVVASTPVEEQTQN